MVAKRAVSVMNVDGSNEIKSCCFPFLDSVNDRRSASWSRDGEWIAVFNANSRSELRFWLARPDGSDGQDIWVAPPGTESLYGSNQVN